MTPRRDARLALVALALTLAGCPGGDEGDGGDPPVDGPVARDAGPLVRLDGGAADGGPVYCPPDDEHEANDSRDTAAEVASGADVHGVVCEGNDDWFTLEVAAGCQLDVRLFMPLEGAAGLGLNVYGPSGALAGASSTLGDTELVTVESTQGGSYAARVRGPRSAITPYTLSMTASCAAELSCPADDPSEGNDEAESATALGSGEPVLGIVCADDDDYYSLLAPQGCVVAADLDYTYADGDVELEVVRADESQAPRSVSNNDDERVLDGAPADGPFTVRVWGNNGAENTYRLSLERTCVSDLSCPTNDPFEPNEERIGSPRLYPPVEVPGVVCGDEDDYFRFFPQSGCTLDLSLSFSHAEGDVELELYNAAGDRLAQSRSSNDDEALSYTAASTASHYARVFLFGSAASNRYRLAAKMDCPE